MSSADIKTKAKDSVNVEASHASAITLIKTARSQLLLAKEQEARGDLRNAFGSYIKAAMLAKMAMDSPEYLTESKNKDGVIRQALNYFLEEIQNDGHDISARTKAVEEKLKADEEKLKAIAPNVDAHPFGASIADRRRALQKNGLSLNIRDNFDLPRELKIPSSSPHSVVPSSSPDKHIETHFPTIDQFNSSFTLSQRNEDPSPPFEPFAVPVDIPNNNRPSGLSNSISAGPSRTKIPIPVKNIASPMDLQSYIRNYNVLIIDVRTREEFEREHIKANAVVCIEPSVLFRENVTAEALEAAMVVSPRQEASLFSNRDKFDLVVVYDNSSRSFGSEHSPLSILVRVIKELAFKKILKRMPMMLVGGIEAWKNEFKSMELIRGSPNVEVQKPIPTKPSGPASLFRSSSSSLAANNSLMNRPLDSSYSTDTTHEFWMPGPLGPPSRHLRSPADAGIHRSESSISLNGTITPHDIPIVPISYPQLAAGITSPPQASINLSGSRSGFFPSPEHQGEPTIKRPPPVASPTRGRQDNRPPPFSNIFFSAGPTPPRISSNYPVIYWADSPIGISGLKNLGNTCYMNAPIQCLSASVPFARFFREGHWKTAVNYTNPLGTKGGLPQAFCKLLHDMWGGDLPYVTPTEFRRSICGLNSQYNGSDQHDSQEFLSFLIDGLHEDLNRILSQPKYSPTPEEAAELERLPPQIGSDREWRSWRSRNDSLIVDYFQGQFRSRLECMICVKTSTTYNVFSILQLPIPRTKSGKVPIERCLDAFFNEEILEKDDAWDCPRCKAKRRAKKKLSLARLPPILMIHLKRFEANGLFSDKVDTFVEFPMKSLDLTNYMPPPLPPGADKSMLNDGLPPPPDDPRTQLPPYRYDLYGVTNHYGNLSSGHYTAFVASKGSWMYCDDSTVKAADSKQVVSQKAYVLFYKRVQ